MNPLVLIAAPVRNRAWILPRYLDAIAALDYPQDRLRFAWFLNDCQDNSAAILSRWMDDDRRGTLETFNTGRTESEYRGATRVAGPRCRAYPVLATLRNRILDEAAWLGADYLLSLDTDVIVRPDTLRRLLDHKKDVVAALVRNGERAWNYLQHDQSRDEYIRCGAPHPGLFRVGLTGAACLYSRRAIQAGRFSVGATGEDEGMARSLRAAGIEMWVDGTHELEHVMEVPHGVG